ncbi:MAG TPA: FAD-binding oxidoreductase [Aquabacterium sp.]|uniref:FAD-binding oxidoreductase n=1 Tax=Aquabacterium sp. TaxID=1872578 RepID=UPI002E31C75A|nr:FAD-binding oxidoreductase [Aquabacterium sp.]HEX5372657.1 FAD-binding oxidoreductase [Aquabacterium sp.]
MRRWNGWGEEDQHFPLKETGLAYIRGQIGAGRILPDASLQTVLSSVPPSRLPPHPLVSQDPDKRVRHARGQSLPDWYAMRSGHFERFPDGVAEPTDTQQVQTLLQWAQDQGVKVIPYGGGTSVAGHITPPASTQPIVTVSMARMNRLISLDKTSQIARFGAGTAGPELERQLAAHGYVLGHFPQSFELSTLGGWVASRSSGQQSMRYGRIEQLFAGGRIETLKGTLDIPSIPASSAGPDLREMFMGSEGRMGILTEVDVRIQRLPEHESFHVAFAPDWDTALNIVRGLVQAKVPVSMLRLSNPEETRTHLLLGAEAWQARLLHRYAALRGCPDGKCMITFGTTGSHRQANFVLSEVKRFVRQGHGFYGGTFMGQKWEHARFRSPHLRHGFWAHGYSVDTLETCVNWSQVSQAMQRIESTLREHAGDGETAHVFSHLSHMYTQGSSIYTTYFFRNSDSYAQTLQRWQAMKSAASTAITALGGTISHQHGVGRDHAPWLHLEKGPLGMAAIGELIRHFDRDQTLNPGCLGNFHG